MMACPHYERTARQSAPAAPRCYDCACPCDGEDQTCSGCGVHLCYSCFVGLCGQCVDCVESDNRSRALAATDRDRVARGEDP